MTITDTQKEQIYRDNYKKVYGYILSKLGDPDTAEDIAADVFVKIFAKINTFDESRASLSTWIYTVARNTLTDFYRTNRTFDEIPETLDDGSSVEDSVCSGEMLERLADALETLDGRERDIIILRFYSGVSLKEIALRMGISYAYVKVLQNRAFDKLRDILEI